MKHSHVALERLRTATLAELEDVYASAPLAPLPTGRWRGTYLRELPMSLPERALSRAMFRWPTFGLDLDRRGWWFGRPGRTVAHFDPVVGASRWRPADVVRLDYRRATPWPFGRMLYDELKPLAPDCILALGGINRRGPRGAWFYFLLEPH